MNVKRKKLATVFGELPRDVKYVKLKQQVYKISRVVELIEIKMKEEKSLKSISINIKTHFVHKNFTSPFERCLVKDKS